MLKTWILHFSYIKNCHLLIKLRASLQLQGYWTINKTLIIPLALLKQNKGERQNCFIQMLHSTRNYKQIPPPPKRERCFKI